MSRFLRRVWAISAKEVRHVLRDMRTLYLALGMPVVLLLLFGFGVSFDLDRLPIAFVDLDGSASSRTFRQRFSSSRDFDDAGLLTSASEAEHALVSGEIIAALVLPRGFERDLVRGRPAELQLLVDGADNNSAVQAMTKAERGTCSRRVSRKVTGRKTSSARVAARTMATRSESEA